MSQALSNFGYCCLMISIWGTIQLGVMSICYNYEAATLYEDCECEPHEYRSYESFLNKVKDNYKYVSEKCLYASITYLVLIFVSIGCIHVANRKLKQQKATIEDTDIFCTPKGFY